MYNTYEDIFLLEEQCWIASKVTRVPVYDFNFRQFFSCKTPYLIQDPSTVIGRIGAIPNYQQFMEELNDINLNPINSLQEHQRCSELPLWYPVIEHLTPRSKVYDQIPDIKDIEQDFTYPFFMKGARQTSKHQKKLAIISSREAYQEAISLYQKDSILHWQKLVCREYIPLRRLEHITPTEKIPPSFELRTFWLFDQCVGFGKYWYDANYSFTQEEKNAALETAKEAAQLLKVPFIAIDVAQTQEGGWIVIECNDAQESGYAGVSPIFLWENVIQVFQQKL